MSITKLYNKKVREEIYNNIMADVRSNSAYVEGSPTMKWISLDFLENILTVHILRDKTESGKPDEKKRTH